MLRERPLIGEFASFKVITPPLDAGILAVTSTWVPKTERVNFWFV
jgi:hypothetical protein